MRRDVNALEGRPFDLLILGGGITGAGVALDAVLRGLRVALIDKGDFASGTSCISSKLVHGGLRYLEQGHVGLVYEALRERRRLLHNAPHLVWPLRFLIPAYDGGRVPLWKYRVGLGLYDVLAGAGNLQRSRSRTSAWLSLRANSPTWAVGRMPFTPRRNALAVWSRRPCKNSAGMSEGWLIRTRNEPPGSRPNSWARGGDTKACRPSGMATP